MTPTAVLISPDNIQYNFSGFISSDKQYVCHHAVALYKISASFINSIEDEPWHVHLILYTVY
ncbi:MAG: hypothetical protein AB2693_11515, partial [Candidatus Thiodiazotropha sp.]